MVHIDGDAQPDIVKQHSVSGFPTLRFLRADGSTIEEARGRTTEILVQQIDDVLKRESGK